VNFLVDAQLPPALARWIVSHDPLIWERARNEQAVIISKDEDFVDRWLLSDQPVPLVWIRKGNCSNRALLAWLEPTVAGRCETIGVWREVH
jgi:predicted nuclease of predicted toxin-antitoxin system